MDYKKIILFLALQVGVLNANAQTSFAPLVEELMPTVVNISIDIEPSKDDATIQNNLIFEETNRENLGSGFIVDNNGHIATNAHVIEKADKISVITSSGDVYNAKLVGQDLISDIALIKIDAKEPLASVVFGNSDDVKVGDWVLAIGNPFGLGSSVSAGIISAKSRKISDNTHNEYFQTDAAINQGNSGGPMFNINGEVIGINSAIFSDTGYGSGVGFALVSNEAKRIVTELKNNGKLLRSWLGLELKKATTKDGLSGLVITSFADETLAKSNNLMIGDMILELNSKSINELKSFSYEISKLAPKSEVLLKIWRDGNIITQKAVVEAITDKNINDEKPIANHKGTLSVELGTYFENFKVTGFLKNSKMSAKGVSLGDEIIKINGNGVSSAEDFNFLIKEAYESKSKLHFDIMSSNGDEYFVEIMLDK